MKKIDPADLACITELARRAGVERWQMNGWARSKDFPPIIGDPVATGGRLYSWSAIQAWLLARTEVRDCQAEIGEPCQAPESCSPIHHPGTLDTPTPTR